MKKFALLALLAAALAVPSIAAAATPQGNLTGSGTFGQVSSLVVTETVIDGGTSYVGPENDKSGTCTGDSGEVAWTASLGFVQTPIVCAHYVASSRDGSGPKMRFAICEIAGGGEGCNVWRISDGGATDKLGFSGFGGLTQAQAEAWVNRGRVGSGLNPTFTSWVLPPLTGGGYTITP
jgi:hypothetical protein